MLIHENPGGNPVTDELGFWAQRCGYAGIKYFSARSLNRSGYNISGDDDQWGIDVATGTFDELRRDVSAQNLVVFSGMQLARSVRQYRKFGTIWKPNDLHGATLEEMDWLVRFGIDAWRDRTEAFSRGSRAYPWRLCYDGRVEKLRNQSMTPVTFPLNPMDQGAIPVPLSQHNEYIAASSMTYSRLLEEFRDRRRKWIVWLASSRVVDELATKVAELGFLLDPNTCHARDLFVECRQARITTTHELETAFSSVEAIQARYFERLAEIFNNQVTRGFVAVCLLFLARRHAFTATVLESSGWSRRRALEILRRKS